MSIIVLPSLPTGLPTICLPLLVYPHLSEQDKLLWALLTLTHRLSAFLPYRYRSRKTGQCLCPFVIPPYADYPIRGGCLPIGIDLYLFGPVDSRSVYVETLSHGLGSHAHPFYVLVSIQGPPF